MTTTYSAGHDYEVDAVVDETPEHVDFFVRDVNDSYGTNDRAGVEVFALADDGREWKVATMIPGKRIRLHLEAAQIGFQCDPDGYPGTKKV